MTKIIGRKIKINGRYSHLERSCTVEISSDFVQSSCYLSTSKHPLTSRTMHSIPTLRGWSVKAQYLMDWNLYNETIYAMKKGLPVVLDIEGDISDAEGVTYKFNLKGNAFPVSASFAGQGKGLVIFNVSYTGDGKPNFSSYYEDHRFIIGTSKLGTYSQTNLQPYL